jgi:S-layer homology domain
MLTWEYPKNPYTLSHNHSHMLQKFLSIFLILSFLISPVYADFRDMESSWYRDSIIELTNEQIISGYGDGTFGPERITRAEILKIILQASGNGLGEVPIERCFPRCIREDVVSCVYLSSLCSPSDQWFF